MPDRPYTVYVRYLRLLLARANVLRDRERNTQENELWQLKRSAELCLALLGPQVEPLYRQVTGLDFRFRVSVGRFGAGKLFDPQRAYQTLDELRNLLKAALRLMARQPGKGPDVSAGHRRKAFKEASTPPRSFPRKTRSRSAYSQADARVFDLIGEDDFQKLTNPEIIKRYRRSAEKSLRRRFTPQSFRHYLNRIRRHHGFPSSRDIRKKVINSASRN